MEFQRRMNHIRAKRVITYILLRCVSAYASAQSDQVICISPAEPFDTRGHHAKSLRTFASHPPTISHPREIRSPTPAQRKNVLTGHLLPLPHPWTFVPQSLFLVRMFAPQCVFSWWTFAPSSSPPPPTPTRKGHLTLTPAYCLIHPALYLFVLFVHSQFIFTTYHHSRSSSLAHLYESKNSYCTTASVGVGGGFHKMLKFSVKAFQILYFLSRWICGLYLVWL